MNIIKNQLTDTEIKLLNSFIGCRLRYITSPSLVWQSNSLNMHTCKLFAADDTGKCRILKISASYKKTPKKGLDRIEFNVEPIEKDNAIYPYSDGNPNELNPISTVITDNKVISSVSVYETMLESKDGRESSVFDSHIVFTFESGKSMILSAKKHIISAMSADEGKVDEVIKNNLNIICFEKPAIRCRISGGAEADESRLSVISLNGYTLEIDLKKTREIYASESYPGHVCDCGNCKEFRRKTEYFSPDAKEFFSMLGIDPAKPGEVYTYDEEKLKDIYNGDYFLCGRIIEKHETEPPRSLAESGTSLPGYIKASDDLLVQFTEGGNMLPENFPSPVLTMSIEAKMREGLRPLDLYLNIIDEVINGKLLNSKNPLSCEARRRLDDLFLELHTRMMEKLRIEDIFLSELISRTVDTSDEGYGIKELFKISNKLRGDRSIFFNHYLTVTPQVLTSEQIDTVFYIRNVLDGDFSPESLASEGAEAFNKELTGLGSTRGKQEFRIFETVPEWLIYQAAELFRCAKDKKIGTRPNPYRKDAIDRLRFLIDILSGVRGTWIVTNGISVSLI